jgi:thiamine-phosphate pyrophosphorylase
MPNRQQSRRPLPKIWLMTDPRLGEGLLAAVRKLPFGSGVVFRHYALPVVERHQLFMQVRRVCRQRGHILVLAGESRWLADGVHGTKPDGRAALRTTPVHNLKEIAKARRMNADIVFLSPMFTTRSHPGARPLGAMRFQQLAGAAGPAKVVALGGMSRNRGRLMNTHIAYGWAAIGAFGN